MSVLTAGDRQIEQTRGSRARFEELYRAHGHEALRLAYLLTGERPLAEDLAHEAFVRVLGRFGELRNPDAFRAYLLRAVVHLTHSHFRRRRTERTYIQSARNISQMATPDRTNEVADREELHSALQAIPERQRIALVLRYCEDLSEPDTADIMRTSTKAVKSLVTRGLANLRSQRAEVTD